MSATETTSIDTPALAINGGQPVCQGLTGKWPHFSEEENRAVLQVMQSGRVNYWTGPQGQAFESEFARALDF